MYRELFTEALRIKKKASSDNRQKHIDDIHQKEIDDHLVGIIGDINVIKTHHTKEVRTGDSRSRDDGVANDLLLNVFRKLFLKPTFKPREKYAVVYKNTKKKWDVMVVELRNKVLSIITIIKKNARTPYDAKQSTRSSQKNIIVESKDGDIQVTDIFIIQ